MIGFQVLLGRGWEVIGTDVINETDEDEITLNSAKTTDAIGLSNFQITKPSLLVLGNQFFIVELGIMLIVHFYRFNSHRRIFRSEIRARVVAISYQA